MRLGIYADNGLTPVGGKLLFDSGSIASNTTAPTGISISPALTLGGGFYWICVQFNTVTPVFFRYSANDPIVMVGSELTRGCFYDRAGGFGAFTDPCPSCTSLSSGTPVMGLRLSSYG